MKSQQLQAKLRSIILENEGDRDDIYSDVLGFVSDIIIEVVTI